LARRYRPQSWPHCVRWRPRPPSPKGTQPPIFGPCLLWSNDRMDQDATWYRDIGLDQSNIVLDGDPAPLSRKGAEPPIFDPCLLWRNGWMDEDVTWYRSRPQPRPHCVRWGRSSPLWKGHSSPLALFGCLLWPPTVGAGILRNADCGMRKVVKG